MNQISVNKRVVITMPDGNEEVLGSSEHKHFAVIYRGNYGRWCVYGVHASRINAETELEDYKEEVGESWPDSHPQVTDQVVTTKMASLSDRNPFPNGIPLR